MFMALQVVDFSKREGLAIHILMNTAIDHCYPYITLQCTCKYIDEPKIIITTNLMHGFVDSIFVDLTTINPFAPLNTDLDASMLGSPELPRPLKTCRLSYMKKQSVY